MFSFTVSAINLGSIFLHDVLYNLVTSCCLLLAVFIFSWYYLRPSSPRPVPRQVPRGLDDTEGDIRQGANESPRVEDTGAVVKVEGITLLGRKPSGTNSPPKAAPGLQILHECDKPDIDIVAVHGLGANPDYAWVWLPKNNPTDGDAYPDKPFNWLKELLPTELDCRVLAFNYYSSWFSNAPHQRLSNISGVLLDSLRNSRDTELARNRPLIFIGHSFGGNIIEQAIVSASRHNSVYAHIAECTVGVVFLGTPHRGSRAAKWGTWIAWLASHVDDAEHRLLKALEEHSDSSMDRLQDFSTWAFTLTVPLVCAFEQLSSDFSSRAGFMGKAIPVKELVVPEESACIDGHHKIPLHVDHFKLNKFYGADDPSFKLLYPEILRLAQGASEALAHRRNPRAIPTDESFAPGDIRKWLQQMRVRNPGDILSDIKRQKGNRVGHSCEWILKRKEFLVWSATEESQLLRLTGSPGIGKTMMATFLVDALKTKTERTPNMAFVYFFCDDKDQGRRTPTAMIRSFIWQLLLQRQELFQHMQPDLEKHEVNRVFESLFDDFSAVWRIFQRMLRDERAGEVVILVDALDECESPAREKLLVELKHYFSSSHGGSLGRTKLLITSRPGTHDIERQLKVVGTSLRMDSAEINDDLSEYIDNRVNEMTDFDGNGYPPLLQKKVRSALKDKAGGTFLWVSLMLAELGSVLMSEVEEKLKDLPRGLDNVYAAILDRIPARNRETAQFILWCMVAARRPLKEVEIQAAFAAWKTGSALNGQELSIYKDIFASLTIDTVRASALRDVWLQRAAEKGDEAVVRQLLQLGAMITTDMNNMTPVHYAVSRGNKELVQFFLNGHVHIDIAVQRHRWQHTEIWHDGIQDIPVQGDDDQRGLTSLHYSTLTGSWEMTEFLLQCGANPNAVSEFGETPLHLALKRELSSLTSPWFQDHWNDPAYSVDGIRDLIDDPDDDTERDEVESIIEEHREKVLALLLTQSRTDVTIQDIDGASPLHSVIYGSRESPKIIELLVQKGAYTSARNRRGQTPLHLACFKGDVPAILTFLELGADGAATDYEGINCLHYTAKSGNIKAIQKMLAAGIMNGNGNLALVSAQDREGRNALHHLAMGFKSVDERALQLLLGLGVDCKALDTDEMSALAYYLGRCSSSYDVVQVSQRFLESGSDIMFKTRTRGLNLAHIHAKSSTQVQVKLLELLARFGVDMQATDNDGRSILHHCARAGSLTLEAFNFLHVEIGLTMMADVDGKTPLHHATAMMLLLENRTTLSEGWSRTERILLDAAKKADGITGEPI
ncbi:hypothetical protein NQ176_g8672 [Zarea fungicola]|uniref:Uncharacterized protein n=1 Tax=Zarea fungicola TaxID=93591 RepID=A0ACC1MT93_9HYPO|nr:hypothetical protein NQ176_g8672 [Lecanicillium fungicola]